MKIKVSWGEGKQHSGTMVSLSAMGHEFVGTLLGQTSGNPVWQAKSQRQSVRPRPRESLAPGMNWLRPKGCHYDIQLPSPS